MDNFDELNNNELRDKLKSAGLANIPVTDTTRKLLIKKLRATVNGTDKPNKRRETVNVVKHVSDDSDADADARKAAKAKAASNRRTIGPASVMARNSSNGVTDAKIMPKPVEKSPSRKTMAAPVPLSISKPTAMSVAPAAVISVAPAAVSSSKAALFDNSDEDLFAAAEAAEKQSQIQKKRLSRSSRSSRSPSLTTSTLVSTSYKHTIEPLIEQDTDVIVLNDDSDEEFAPELTEKLKKRNTPTTKVVAGPESRRLTMQTGPSITANYTSITQTTTTDDSASAYRRRYTTHTPIKQKETDDELLKRVETPYLSDFIRRLEKLKKEPLAGAEVTASPSTSSAYRREPRPSFYGEGMSSARTRIIEIQQPDTLLKTLEKNVRLPLLIFLAIVVVVAIYVFFFSNY